jgi:hypothetical protein
VYARPESAPAKAGAGLKGAEILKQDECCI